MNHLKILTLLFLIGGGILLAGSTFAAKEVTGGCCDTTIVFNTPFPAQMYNLGDAINLSGSLRVTSCGNGLFYNKLTFYITEDKDIPITDCCGNSTDNCSVSKSCGCQEGCQDCYGAKHHGNRYYSSCDCQWCDQVKYLDLAKAKELGYKVYKLGEIYPADVYFGAKPYLVAYNENFIIPQDLGFTGPVRFYVQYSGTHWNMHWHWNIAYQSGIINSPPEKPQPVGEGEVWSNCQIQELSIPTFQWTYEDKDGDPQKSYEIRIDNDPDFSTVDSDEFSRSGGSSTTFTFTLADWTFLQKWNTKYWWIVRVKDNQGNWSSWSDPNQFTTPLHAFPYPYFTHTPKTPAPGEKITLVDKSICYDFNNNPYNCKDNTNIRYQWDFENDGKIDCDSNTNSSCRGNTTSIIQSSGTYIKLSISDDIGTCSSTGDSPISTRSPFPEWKEVAPY